MKKLLILGLLSAGLSVNAAEMSFITVLSSPVGSFNRLEAVDFSAPASASAVNFCTKVGSSGSVQLKGLQSASLGAVALASGTRLGRSGAGDYVLNSIRLNSDGAVEGGRLLANNVTVSGQGVGKSSNLYGTTLTVAGAKTKGLNVGNGKSKMSGQWLPTEMVWSNEYQNDTAACGTKCNQQYLLKSKGKASSSGDGSTSGKKRCLTKYQYCDKYTRDQELTKCEGLSCDWYLNGHPMLGWEGFPTDILSKYGNVYDTGCTPGTECNTCTLSKKYTSDSAALSSYYGYGARCCDSSSGTSKGKILYSLVYALCTELEDCSMTIQNDCAKWDGTFGWDSGRDPDDLLAK